MFTDLDLLGKGKDNLSHPYSYNLVRRPCRPSSQMRIGLNTTIKFPECFRQIVFLRMCDMILLKIIIPHLQRLGDTAYIQKRLTFHHRDVVISSSLFSATTTSPRLLKSLNSASGPPHVQ